jgi:hypothetical protein
MKCDFYLEICLWNKNVDSLVRVLQRMEALGILPQQTMKAHELRLEEIRAALNADFSEAMFVSERGDHLRLNEQRSAWEQQNQSDAPQ